MKVSLLFISILILNVFSITRIYYYDKCDPSYESFMDARKSVGIKGMTTLHIERIAKLNSVQKEVFKRDYKFPYDLYLDPEVNDYLLNLLKEGKLISYIDNYLPIEEIKKNFENTDDFYQNKNILTIMCSYFLQQSNMKTPFIAAILGILDYTKNFGKLQYYGENSELVGKIVTQISLKDLKKLNANYYRIGCLEWKKEDAKKLLEFYLEEGKGSDKLNLEQVALAEAKMIVKDLLTKENRRIYYEKWNDIIELKNERYYDHPPDFYAQNFLNLFDSCRVYCPDSNKIDKIYKIITVPLDYSEHKKKIIELQEKVYKMTNDLFGVEITYSEELAVEKINLPYVEICIQIFHDIKFEKKGIINYIIQNNKIKSIDFSFNVDMIDNILNKIKEALKGKFQIISLEDLNKKMEQSISNANIYINYIFPSTLEFIVKFSSELNKNIEQDSVVVYTITFKQNNLYKEVIKNLFEENFFVEALSIAYAFIQDGFEKVLEFLKDSFFNEYSLINLLLILIGLGMAGVTGGDFVPIPI